MIHRESVGEQTVIRFNHVEIAVARKFCVHAVTGLARFAVADPVRQHDEKFRSIQRLTSTKKFTGKFRSNKLRAAAGRSVHDQNCIGRFALRIFLRFAERPVVDAQLRQRFARLKFKIRNRVIAFSRWGIIASRRDTRSQAR